MRPSRKDEHSTSPLIIGRSGVLLLFYRASMTTTRATMVASAASSGDAAHMTRPPGPCHVHLLSLHSKVPSVAAGRACERVRFHPPWPPPWPPPPPPWPPPPPPW